jgi:hypothetical protein
MNARARPANYHKLPREEQDAWYAENVIDLPPAFSDDALALRFCDRHEGVFLFVAAWGNGFVGMGRAGGRMTHCMPTTLPALSAARRRPNAMDLATPRRPSRAPKPSQRLSA